MEKCLIVNPTCIGWQWHSVVLTLETLEMLEILSDFEQSLSKQSLEHMVTAYQKVTATHTCKGGNESEERSITAQLAIDLHNYFFPDGGGKVLYQMPVYGRSERPEWLASLVNDYVVVPVSKLLMVCDFNLSLSRTETFAYCSRVLGEMFRLLIALCATCTDLGMYSFNGKMGRTKICRASVANTDEIFVLYAAVSFIHCRKFIVKS